MGSPVRTVQQEGRIQSREPAKGHTQRAAGSKHHKSYFGANTATLAWHAGKSGSGTAPGGDGDTAARAGRGAGRWRAQAPCRNSRQHLAAERQEADFARAQGKAAAALIPLLVAHTSKAATAACLRPLTYGFLCRCNCSLPQRVMFLLWIRGELGSSFTNLF